MRSAPGLTKLTLPDVRSAYPRKRVHKRLDRALGQRLVWIWAPAGAGKTTLLASWVRERRFATLFYRVDRGDRDVATLFHFLPMASPARTKRGARVEPPAFTSDVADLRAFARRFFEAFFAHVRGSARQLIVFDDGHEVDDGAPLWQVLREAIEVTPASVTFVVASRRPPPAELARGIAHGNVEVIDFDELKLNAAESRGLLKARFGQHSTFSAARAQALHERAAGWAAGLMLLAAADAGVDDAPNRQAPHAADAHLFDYFATEVLASMPVAYRLYAMKTAVLGAIDDEIVDALIPREERVPAAELLRRVSLVERQGAHWHYHPLFRAFLLARAPEELGHVVLDELRRRACRLLLERSRFDEAFELARDTGDVEEIRNVLVRSAPRLMELGRTRTLAEWTSVLPESAFRSDPWLALVRAQAIWTDRPREARELFLVAVESSDPGCSTLGCAGALQATAFEGEDFRRLDALLDRALDQRASALPPALGIPLTIATLGAVGFRRPTDPRLPAYVRHAHELVRQCRDERLRGLLAGLLVAHETFFGDPLVVQSVLDDLEIGGASRISDALARIGVLLAHGLQRWLAGAVDGALDTVREGLAMAARSGVHVWDDQLYAVGAAATIGAGRRGGSFLEPLTASSRRSQFAFGNAAFYRAWDALVAGDVEAAAQHGRAAHRSARAIGSPFACTLTSALLARVAVAQGALDEAERHLADATDAVDGTGSRVNHLPILVANAALARARGRDSEEADAHRRVCAIVRETGVLGYFLVSHDDLAQCAASALHHQVEPTLARHLVHKLRLDPPPSARSLVRWPWRVRVRVFGGVGVDVAEETDGPGSRSRRTLELLATIVALGPSPAHQTRLSDELWPDAEGDAARASFDTTLLRLRRRLGGDAYVRMENGRVALDERSVFVDLFAAEHWMERARAALQAQSFGEAQLAMTELAAVALGRPFEGLEGGVFATRRRAFERRLLSLLDSALDAQRTARVAELASLVHPLLGACDAEDPRVLALARRLARE